MITKVFLSGGFNSNWQQQVIAQLKEGFNFLNPSEHGLESPEQYTAWNIHQVKQCDILFAYMEETNPSGYGLALEVGLANALGKTIILIDERSRKDKTFGRYFRIVQHSSSVVFDNLEAGINFLKAFSDFPR